MKYIYQVRCRSYDQEKSSAIYAYINMSDALDRVRMLNAQYGQDEPYFMRKKIVD